jgi:hypothetical protein
MLKQGGEAIILIQNRMKPGSICPGTEEINIEWK